MKIVIEKTKIRGRKSDIVAEYNIEDIHNIYAASCQDLPSLIVVFHNLNENGTLTFEHFDDTLEYMFAAKFIEE